MIDIKHDNVGVANVDDNLWDTARSNCGENVIVNTETTIEDLETKESFLTKEESELLALCRQAESDGLEHVILYK